MGRRGRFMKTSFHRQQQNVINSSRKIPDVFARINEIPLQTVTENRFIKFNTNPSRGSRVDTCRQTDGHGEDNSCFSRLLAKRLKINWTMISIREI